MCRFLFTVYANRIAKFHLSFQQYCNAFPVFLYPDEKVMADDEFTCDIFRFLQLLCEGHNNGEWIPNTGGEWEMDCTFPVFSTIIYIRTVYADTGQHSPIHKHSYRGRGCHIRYHLLRKTLTRRHMQTLLDIGSNLVQGHFNILIAGALDLPTSCEKCSLI